MATPQNSDIQTFMRLDKYARFDQNKGRRETWNETVTRAVNYLDELAGFKLHDSTLSAIKRAISEKDAMPSMRLIAMAGPAARRNNIAIYNCSYLAVDRLSTFHETLLISMSGCGVGFSVEQEYISKLPRVRNLREDSPVSTYQIEDTTEGWCKAVEMGVATWWSGRDIMFDYSLIRPEGAKLLTKGGTASGPKPLREMLDFLRETIRSCAGSYITPIKAYDMMCMIGNGAVSGGTRRTAMICLFDEDNQEMLEAKFPENFEWLGKNFQRANANNSVVLKEEKTYEAMDRILRAMDASGAGEPGIFSRYAAEHSIPERRRLETFGVNPCVTGDTWVHTSNGPKQVRDLLGVESTLVVDGALYTTTQEGFWKTGERQTLELNTVEGYGLRLTENHKILKVSRTGRDTVIEEWVEAGTLRSGDTIRLNDHRAYTAWDGHGTFSEGWILGSLVGDGTFTTKTAHLTFWGPTRKTMVDTALQRIKQSVKSRSDMRGHEQHNKERIAVTSVGLKDLAESYGIVQGGKQVTDEVERSSSDFHRGFLQGLFDADGSVQISATKGSSIRLSQSSLPVLKRVQRMLLRLGIVSRIYTNRRTEGYRMLPDNKGGLQEYFCQANHDLVISKENIGQYADQIGFTEPEKKEKLNQLLFQYRRTPNKERFYVRVQSIVATGDVEDVYDCTVPGIHAFDANGLYVHNCGEILLRNRQFCNLSIAVARPGDTLEDLMYKVEIATIIGTIQSLATYFPGLPEEWKENCEEERLLGVDITGQLDVPHLFTDENMRALRDHAIEVNKVWAAFLGVNQSAAVTCVKPSGNSGQFLDVSSGMHARWSEYYIRHITVGRATPMFRFLQDQGVPLIILDETKALVPFPVSAPKGAVVRSALTAKDQLERWMRVKKNWTEHNPSCTIYYKDDELQTIIDVLADPEFQKYAGGLSFAQDFDVSVFAHPPYKTITREEFLVAAMEFPNIDWDQFYDYDLGIDNTTIAQELACVSGLCEVEFVPL